MSKDSYVLTSILVFMVMSYFGLFTLANDDKYNNARNQNMELLKQITRLRRMVTRAEDKGGMYSWKAVQCVTDLELLKGKVLALEQKESLCRGDIDRILNEFPLEIRLYQFEPKKEEK